MKAFVYALLFTLAPVLAFAAKVDIRPVGKHGGSRLYLTCQSGQQSIPCMLDTGSPLTTFFEDDYNKDWESLGKYQLKGFVTLACDNVVVKNFSISGLAMDGTKACRTNTEIMREYGVHIGFNVLSSTEYTIDLITNDMSMNTAATAPLRHSLSAENKDRPPIALAQIENFSFEMEFDTGAPVTLIDTSILKKFPEHFETIEQNVSDELKSYGITVYNLKGKINVGSIVISSGYVYVVDLSRFWSQSARPLAFLGMNHMIGKKWIFSPATKTWDVKE